MFLKNQYPVLLDSVKYFAEFLLLFSTPRLRRVARTIFNPRQSPRPAEGQYSSSGVPKARSREAKASVLDSGTPCLCSNDISSSKIRGGHSQRTILDPEQLSRRCKISRVDYDISCWKTAVSAPWY